MDFFANFSEVRPGISSLIFPRFFRDFIRHFPGIPSTILPALISGFLLWSFSNFRKGYLLLLFQGFGDSSRISPGFFLELHWRFFHWFFSGFLLECFLHFIRDSSRNSFIAFFRDSIRDFFRDFFFELFHVFLSGFLQGFLRWFLAGFLHWFLPGFL